MERNRSLKVFKLFAECVREASQAAAVHSGFKLGDTAHSSFTNGPTDQLD
jgi:hypothetical protein